MIPGWIPQFMMYVAGLSVILLFGYWRVRSHRRFRVRGTLPTSPKLEATERWYIRSALVTAVGIAFMLARFSGAPPWTGSTGGIVAIAGFVALSGSLGAYLIERFRLPRKQPTRPAA
jgi:hypothetical protein